MILKPKMKSLYITTDYDDFVYHYQNVYCKISKLKNIKDISLKESIHFLLKALDSFFNALNVLFKKTEYSKNVTIYTLIQLLKKDDRPKACIKWKIKQYLNYLKINNLSFKDHLIDAFLMHLNKKHLRKPKYKKNYKLFYFINCEIKSFLFKIIRKVIYKSKRDFYTNSSYFSKSLKYFDIYKDNGYLSIVKKENPFLFSMYIKYIEDYDDQGFYLFLKTYSNNSKKDKEDLCQLIKKLLYSS
jgi:hypothetical protein